MSWLLGDSWRSIKKIDAVDRKKGCFGQQNFTSELNTSIEAKWIEESFILAKEILQEIYNLTKDCPIQCIIHI